VLAAAVRRAGRRRAADKRLRAGRHELPGGRPVPQRRLRQLPVSALRARRRLSAPGRRRLRRRLAVPVRRAHRPPPLYVLLTHKYVTCRPGLCRRVFGDLNSHSAGVGRGR